MSSDAERADEPVNINALGPSNASEQVEETRHYDNNIDAVADKNAEALKAQMAPNPTTDVDLAREAYGDDWGKRRGPKVIGRTSDGAEITDHGGVAVDAEGHALGHATDPEGAVALKESLGRKTGDADRYPVTDEARARARAENGEDDESY